MFRSSANESHGPRRSSISYLWPGTIFDIRNGVDEYLRSNRTSPGPVRADNGRAAGSSLCVSAVCKSCRRFFPRHVLVLKRLTRAGVPPNEDSEDSRDLQLRTIDPSWRTWPDRAIAILVDHGERSRASQPRAPQYRPGRTWSKVS